MIADAGHEVGNHSFNHEPWLHLYSKQQIDDEITKAGEAIEDATGKRPFGFRGPGYSLSTETLEVLAQRDYLYDASTFPTFLGPLARAYYFLTSKLDDSQRHQRKKLFGGFRDGLQPLKPYLWGLGKTDIVEIPVTTMPGFRLPFHFSYLHYISTFSSALSLLYLRAAVLSCRATGIAPSLLLHPLDFLGSDDVPELSFFPAMKNESAFKLAVVKEFLRIIHQRFSVETMGTFQQTVRTSRNTKTRHPGTTG
jgi:hypothetical protein